MDALDEEVSRKARAWQMRIGELSGRHVAIEALWDGDTTGWFLDVGVVTARTGTPETFFARLIDSLRYGGDVRLFEGKVPPWPEAIVAQRAGHEVAAALGLELYFPSPTEPDDDCPHWWERDVAIRCSACDKLLRPDRGQGLPAPLCHHCQIAAQNRERLAADAPGNPNNRIVYVVLEDVGRPTAWLGLNLQIDGDGVVAHLAAALRSQRPPAELSERVCETLTVESVGKMERFCEEAIDEALLDYVPKADLPERFGLTHAVTWHGVTHTIQTRFHANGERIASLLRRHEFFRRCREAGPIHVIGNGGVTYRDVSFLRFAAARGGECRIDDLRAAHAFLASDAVEQTMSKLEHRGFLTREDDFLRLRLKGLVIDVAGP